MNEKVKWAHLEGFDKVKWALPGLVWAEIQSSTMKIDRSLEVLDVAEPSRRLLHPLDGGVDGLQASIGEPVLEGGQDVREVPPNQLRHRRHRGQPAMSGRPEPAGEAGQSRAAIGVVPEPAEAFLEGPGAHHLEIAMLEMPQGRPLRVTHVLRPHPEVLRPRKALVVSLLQCPVLGLAHVVHRIIGVLLNVKLVEDDLGRGVVHVGQRRLDVRLPHPSQWPAAPPAGPGPVCPKTHPGFPASGPS